MGIGKQWVRVWPWLVLGILPMLWWHPLLRGFLPDFMDTVAQMYPYRLAAAREFLRGDLPLWLPNQFSGMPLAANPQVAVWYPPQILFYLFPGALSYGILIVLHYMAAGWGMWLLARRLGCAPMAALFAALLFQFGSMLVTRVALVALLPAVALIPWMLWAIEGSVRRRASARESWRWAMLVGVLVALQVLSGAPQMSYYTAMLLPVWWLVRGATERGLAGFGEAFLRGSTAGLLTVTLSAVQLLPTLDFVAQTERAALDPQKLAGQGLGGSMAWRALVGFTGTPVEDTDSLNAIGWGALLLVPVALIGRRRRGVGVMILLIGLGAWLMAWAPLVPYWCRIIPMYDSFHAPRRTLILWSVVGPLGAGLGAHYFSGWLRAKKAPSWVGPIVLLISLAPSAWMLGRLEREFVLPERHELPEEYRAIFGQERFLALDPNFRYMYDSRRPDFAQSLMPNTAAWLDLQDPQGYDPLVLKRYGLVRMQVSPGTLVLVPSHGVVLTDPTDPVMRLLAVQHVVGRFDLYDPPRLVPGTRPIDQAGLRELLEPVTDDPYWPVWRIKEERPQAWIVQTTAPASSAEEAFHLAKGNNPYIVAFTESPVYIPENRNPRAVKLERPTGRTMVASFSEPLRGAAFLCISSSWANGWNAWDDEGRKLQCLPTNGFMTGVVVPEGTVGVTLVYTPAAFAWGLIISLVGWIFVAGFFFMRTKAELRSEVHRIVAPGSK